MPAADVVGDRGVRQLRPGGLCRRSRHHERPVRAPFRAVAGARGGHELGTLGVERHGLRRSAAAVPLARDSDGAARKRRGSAIGPGGGDGRRPLEGNRPARRYSARAGPRVREPEMKPTQPEILAYVLKTVQDLCQDWDYADPVGPESLLFSGLGMESLDAVVLCTAIQEHYQTTMPFAELLADIGQKQRDLSIAELAEFVCQHVSAGVEAEQQEVEAASQRRA